MARREADSHKQKERVISQLTAAIEYLSKGNKMSLHPSSDHIRCCLQQYREEIIQDGIGSLPPEIRDAVIDELFGPEKTAQNGETGNTGDI